MINTVPKPSDPVKKPKKQSEAEKDLLPWQQETDLWYEERANPPTSMANTLKAERLEPETETTIHHLCPICGF